MAPKYYVKAEDCRYRDAAEPYFYDENPLDTLDAAKAWSFEQRHDFDSWGYRRIIIFECTDNILKPILQSLDFGVSWEAYDTSYEYDA